MSELTEAFRKNLLEASTSRNRKFRSITPEFLNFEGSEKERKQYIIGKYLELGVSEANALTFYDADLQFERMYRFYGLLGKSK